MNETNLNLTLQEVNIITQALLNSNVQVKDAHFVLNLVQKIETQINTQIKEFTEKNEKKLNKK